MSKVVDISTAKSKADVLKSGGGDGTYDPMEARVKALENSVSEIKGDLKTIVRDTSEIKGKLSNMPATWQIFTMMIALLALVIASGGALLGLLRYTAPGT